jgi:hypothetical protein
MRSLVGTCGFWQALTVAEQVRKACQNGLTVRVWWSKDSLVKEMLVKRPISLLNRISEDAPEFQTTDRCYSTLINGDRLTDSRTTSRARGREGPGVNSDKRASDNAQTEVSARSPADDRRLSLPVMSVY